MFNIKDLALHGIYLPALIRRAAAAHAPACALRRAPWPSAAASALRPPGGAEPAGASRPAPCLALL